MDEFTKNTTVRSRYAKVPGGMGLEDGCLFLVRNAGVQCPQKDHYGKCPKCGWNPHVEDIKKQKIRERMKADVR